MTTQNGNIEVKISDLQKTKLFLATPMYGGLNYANYLNSVLELQMTCMRYGIIFQAYYMSNESLIQRARNYLTDEFLRAKVPVPRDRSLPTNPQTNPVEEQPFTHMLFIDADVSFKAEDVIGMLALSIQNEEYDVLCGPYPKKTIAWEKIKAAVDQGVADQNPAELENYVGDYVFNPVDGKNTMRLDEPVEVLEGGTGYMLIKREAFAKFDTKFKQERSYLPDHVRTKAFDGSREIMAYFHCYIDPKSKRYLSEDYAFCQDLRSAGGKIWLCPWVQTEHTGTYSFGGSLPHLASIKAHVTADTNVPKK